jgi:hypothetical protein
LFSDIRYEERHHREPRGVVEQAEILDPQEDEVLLHMRYGDGQTRGQVPRLRVEGREEEVIEVNVVAQQIMWFSEGELFGEVAKCCIGEAR